MEWLRRLIGMVPQAGDTIALLDLPFMGPSPPTVYTRYTFSEPHLRVAAVGDLHGRIDLLRSLGADLDALAADPAKRLVEVYLGDYVDRSGDAAAVLEFLATRSAATDRDVVCLAGNHEQLMMAALDGDEDFLAWLKMGGHTTLLSYGVSPARAKGDPSGTRAAFRAAIPASHMAFLKRLKLSYSCGGFFFVHAGVRPGLPLAQQTSRDMLWIRERFLTSNADFGKVVVHGHTPVPKPQFRPNRIGIDTGAYYSGRLTCLLVTTETVSVLKRQQRSGAVPLQLSASQPSDKLR